MRVDRLRKALQTNEVVRDEDFDALLPLALRRVSSFFWTPVQTARRAAELLETRGARRVLDVGAGVGKFCIVAAFATKRVAFQGLEHRPHLVAAAREAIQQLRAERVEIRLGKLDDVPRTAFDAYDGFYFFNPFSENIGAARRLDASVELSESRYDQDIERTREVLDAATSSACVVTYCGLGPAAALASYELIHTEESCGGTLRLWAKRPDAVVVGDLLGPCPRG